MSKLRELADALDERTGYRALLGHALDEPIPGGARFAYVFGSVLTVLFGAQALTGIVLMTGYAPSAQSAWASVHQLTFVTNGGWLVRGIHHFGAQAMVIGLVLHVAQTALYGAYKKPRELNWWFGLALLGVVLGFALTGYLLPWDQKGYWATRVATNIAGTVPIVGPATQRFLQGGSDYSSFTLTRFHALHVVVLPAALAGLLGLHLALFRKHGVTTKAGADTKRSDTFFPRQVLLDTLAALAAVSVVVVLTVLKHGAPLDAPADPSSDYPARPEWYFLPLFELLKYFHGPLEPVGTIGIPLAVGAYLFALPLIDRSPSRALRDRWKALLPLVFIGVAGPALIGVALRKDESDKPFQAARATADTQARFANELARKGVPPEGPLAMLQRHPDVRGPQLFAKHCAACHVLGTMGTAKDSVAPKLDGWGTEAWVLGLLAEPDHESRFGRTSFAGTMPSITRCAKDAADCKPMSPADADAVAAFLASEGDEPGVPIPADAKRVRKELVDQGRKLVSVRCTSCHLLEGKGDDVGDEMAPELSRWASVAWITAQIDNPASPKTYRKNALAADRKGHMPAFASELSKEDIALLATWLHAQTRR
jgi:ubiquinol-cytochrome c reductase cytochrome b subunit